jgi:hypothetical protein
LGIYWYLPRFQDLLIYESANQRPPPSNGNFWNYCTYLERLQDLLIYESANQRSSLFSLQLGKGISLGLLPVGLIKKE